MSGTWESQNKVLPGAYINFRTNAPLSITPGARGVAVILQEMNVGTAGEMYRITATDTSKYPDGISAAQKLLVNEALKGAQTVILYNLGTVPADDVVLEDALEALQTLDFNAVAYPYTGSTYTTNQGTIKTWIDAMRNDEGKNIQAVLAGSAGDFEGVINVTKGVKLADGTALTVAQCTAWVAGITAGANINQSNTGRKYEGAIDVVPRMTKLEMETAIAAGEFIFKVDTAQNVTVVYDINSLTTVTTDKGPVFKKNRVIRTIDGINNDIAEIYESNYIGKVNNNEDGRSLLRATLIEYFNQLQSMGAIQNFVPDDVTVEAGTASDAVVITCRIQPVDSIEKIYITVNL
ncbi:MAG: phage tail sheath protein [Herbinix sp.]|jgi:hypothetical protein|nr:phage tail sheath protein [Herbinix sp.]